MVRSLAVDEERGTVLGRDCINGTAMPAAVFEDYTNFTTLMNLFQVTHTNSLHLR